MNADYIFYTQTYGGTMTEEEFSRYYPKAKATIEALTFGRSETATGKVALKVQQAICAVVDELGATSNGILASASNDGYSETYAVSRSAEQRLQDAAYLYLASTGLMFRGGLRRC